MKLHRVFVLHISDKNSKSVAYNIIFRLKKYVKKKPNNIAREKRVHLSVINSHIPLSINNV